MIQLAPRRIASFSLLALVLVSQTAFAAQTMAPRANLPMTRAAFVKTLIDGIYEPKTIDPCFKKLSPSKYRLLFSDVSIDQSYAPELCVAMRAGIIEGYRDGSFRPDRPINFAEAAKILTRALVLSPMAGLPEGKPWYYGYVKSLEYRGAIPATVSSFEHQVTATELDEILHRLETGATESPSIGYDELVKRTRAMYTHPEMRG